MDQELFNLELRKFLKRFGITAQREMEKAKLFDLPRSSAATGEAR